MNLQMLIDGPSRVTNEFGSTTELIRVMPRVDREFRKVYVSVTPMTTKQKFLYPWREDKVLQSWDMTATLVLKNGRRFTVSKLVRMDFDRGVEMVALQVVREATIDKLKAVEARIAM